MLEKSLLFFSEVNNVLHIKIQIFDTYNMRNICSIEVLKHIGCNNAAITLKLRYQWRYDDAIYFQACKIHKKV